MTSVTCIAKVTTCVLLLGCATTQVTASAIPMWEFLSRDEKVSSDYERGSFGFFQFCAQIDIRGIRRFSLKIFSLDKKTININLYRKRIGNGFCRGKMLVASLARCLLIDKDCLNHA